MLEVDLIVEEYKGDELVEKIPIKTTRLVSDSLMKMLNETQKNYKFKNPDATMAKIIDVKTTSFTYKRCEK